MNGRAVATAVGAGLALIGLALVVVPGLADGMSVGRFFVLLAGVFAALLLVVDVRALVLADVDLAIPADVEEGITHPRAGAVVDDLLVDAAQGYDRHTQKRRDRLEAQVREVAVEVLARREDCTPEAAEAMLVEGSWTDDPYAAAFLGAHDLGDLPLRERVFDALRPEARFARRATHAIHAIADLEATDNAAADREAIDHDATGRVRGDHDHDHERVDREPPEQEVDLR